MVIKRILILVFSCFVSAVFAGQQLVDSIYVAKYKDDKQCAISYTFDDGLEEHFTLVYPRFQQLGFKATFWVNGNTINQDAIKRSEKPRISWNNLKLMSDNGMEISNHGWSHKNLTKCTPEELKIEIERNDSIIEAQTGKRPVTFCYAGNAKNEMVIKSASVNRVATRTSQFSMGSKSTSKNLRQRIDTLLQHRDWGIAMIHGITYGYDAFKSDSVLWNHLNEVKTIENTIWIGTFKEVAAYVAEQKNIQLLIRHNKNKTVIKPVIKLDHRLFNEPLTMVLKANSCDQLKVSQKKQELLLKIVGNKATFEFNPSDGPIIVERK